MMSLFCWSGRDTAKREEELHKPEPKGLEIIVGDAPISVKYNNETIGNIEKINNVYKFHMVLERYSIAANMAFYGNYDSDLLKGIAAKLDELNGVDIYRDKLEYELQMLLMTNVYNKSKSEMQSINKRISEIRNILNNP